MHSLPFAKFAVNYLHKLSSTFDEIHFRQIASLAEDLHNCWSSGRRVYICGNGGSAANALHISNDFHYGIGSCGDSSDVPVPGLRVEALTSNTSILTCLANDIGYDKIFSNQLLIKAVKDDLVLFLTGSGNSSNIVNGINASISLNLNVWTIVAFDGGKVKDICNNTIHFNVNDMQIAEDIQLIVGHMCMKWLNENKIDPCSEPKIKV